jgi:hypothetical protein
MLAAQMKVDYKTVRNMRSILFFFKQDLETKLIFASLLFSSTVIFIYLISVWISNRRKKRERELNKIREQRQEMLSLILFDDNPESEAYQTIFGLPEFASHSTTRLGKRKKNRYRQIMLNEMLDIKKNLSQASLTPLYELYNKLELHKDSLRKMKSRKYREVVLGIREAASMNYKYHYKEIYDFTNHPNEIIRVEAQEAMVRIWQSSGLRFLSKSSYDVSDWEQMSLINLLQLSNNKKPKHISKWLSSDNYTIVIFALRLSALYNCYELLEKIYNCLYHTHDRVKTEAVNCLKTIYDENTELLLTDYFKQVSTTVQRSVMRALASMASSESTSFFFQQLRHNDVEIRFWAVKSLHSKGYEHQILTALENEPEQQSDVMLMLDQIKTEENLYKQ